MQSDHEEADTRLLLHAKHAANEGVSSILIECEDSDVMMLLLAYSEEIKCKMYMKRGTLNRMRIIDIGEIRNTLSDGIAKALPGYHAFTGCDSVSAFAGKGKLAGFRLLKREPRFQEAFQILGQSLNVPEPTIEVLEEFVCCLYGINVSNVTDLRYLLFCAKGGEIGSHLLPPSKACLHQHILRANYQAYVWQQCLKQYMHLPSPEGNGWYIDDKDELRIKWSEEDPAPCAVLELMSCNCKKNAFQRHAVVLRIC